MKVLAALLLAVAACSTKAPDPTPPPAAETKAEPDRVVVLAHHRPLEATDPVLVQLDRFKVVAAHFDPDHLEGGTATIELDLTSLATGERERDDDLRSAAYLDTTKFATATIHVANVHPHGTIYTADATVDCRGITKVYPVTFMVLAHRGRSIQIRGEHTFSRNDFGIGIDPADDPMQHVDSPLTIQMTLTLTST